MLYTGQQVYSPTGMFQGRVQEDVFAWESNLPSLDTQQFFTTSGYDAIIETAAGGSIGSASFFEVAGRTATFQGLRNCMGYVAQAYGYFQSARTAVATFYSSPLVDIARMVAGAVMKQIEIAVNSISWVPVVGWIIKILYEVADLIFDIVKIVRKKQENNDKKAIDALARSAALPVASVVPEADTFMGRALQLALLDANLDWMITPQLKATSASDFHAFAQRTGDGSGTCIDGYIIKGTDDAKAGGLGFMPGSMNIHGAMELSTRGAGIPPRDLGAYLPVTQSMAAAIWSQAVKGDSGLIFATDTGAVAGLWSDYVRSAAEFAHDKLDRGWSMMAGRLSSGPAEDATKFQCTTACSQGLKGCNKGRDWGKWRKVPSGVGHRRPYIDYLYELFQWGGGSVDPSKVNWDDIATSRALNNLLGRQEAMLQSVTCMYLDDASSTGGPQRYQAIRRGSGLHRRWQSNVQAMFESGDWTRVNYQDVIPGGDVDTAIQDRMAQRGTTAADFFNMDAANEYERGLKPLDYESNMGATVLGDPVPPSPEDPVDFKPVRKVSWLNGQSKGRKSSATPVLVAGAAAAAFMALRKSR